MQRENFRLVQWKKSIFAFFLVFFLSFTVYIWTTPTSSFDLSQIDWSDYIGYPILNIPDIGLSTPVEVVNLSNRRLETPAFVAGSYSKNQNKTLLIGHSSTVFQSLDQVKTGMSFSYDGEIYQISEITVEEKKDINMGYILSPADEETIIIMTCAGDSLPNQDATHRLIVTAIKEPSLAINK